MLYDKEFLLKLDKSKNKTIYAKITALTFNESPIETIEGRVTQGSINLDGASAVRRTCSLTIVAQDFDYQNYYWGMNTKFKLEIGVQNLIDPLYPDIIWFDQGIYLITSFNTSRSSNNFSISLQGKDKMCLLNGEVGGSINSSVDFGMIEEEDQNGVWAIRKIPIKEIIRNMVHQYGGEPLHNIVINDIPDYGLELLEYRYDIPMYLYRKKDSLIYANATLDGTIKCNIGSKSGPVSRLADLAPQYFDMLVDPLTGVWEDATTLYIEEEPYIVAKVEYGQTAGYRKTELTYAGDLIANVGESVTSILDKIKNMLGEYEYFYDLNGQFVFQQKRSFVNTLYSPIVDGSGENNNESYVESLALASAVTYNFSEGELITTFNNNPNLLNLRNDYSVWGQRTTVSGAQVPVHLRYAIDTKPTEYTSIVVLDEEVAAYNEKYGTTLKGQESTTYFAEESDWREVIYQMALDFYKYNHLDDFELKVAAANPDLYPSGITGYEQYYIDLQGFWRQLYNPYIQEQISQLEKRVINTENEKGDLIIAVEVAQQKVDSEHSTAGEQELAQLHLETAQLNLSNAEEKLKSLLEEKEYYYYDETKPHLYWNKSVYEQPEALNFWFDFLDVEGELSQFNTKVIGSRPKAVNDSNVKSIYFRDTPEVFFIESIEDKDNSFSTSAYKYIQAPGILKMFSISAQGKSAKNKLDELIYQHGYCIESTTINCIPIYYLEPNTRIHITDKETNINGDYIVSKITIPLTYNGTMSITATKAAETILY